MRFLNSVIKDFENKDFKFKPPFFLIDNQFCNESEKVSKQLLKKLNGFT